MADMSEQSMALGQECPHSLFLHPQIEDFYRGGLVND